MWSNELGLFERWERSHGDLLPLLTIVADTPKHADAAFERIGGERGLGAALKGKNKAMACAFAEKIALFGKAKEVEAFVQTFSSIASSLIKEERYFTPEEEAISRNRDFAAAPQIAALRVLSLLSRKGSAIALKEMTKVAAMQLNTWLELSATQRQFRYVMCTTIVDCLGDFLEKGIVAERQEYWSRALESENVKPQNSTVMMNYISIPPSFVSPSPCKKSPSHNISEAKTSVVSSVSSGRLFEVGRLFVSLIRKGFYKINEEQDITIELWNFVQTALENIYIVMKSLFVQTESEERSQGHSFFAADTTRPSREGSALSGMLSKERPGFRTPVKEKNGKRKSGFMTPLLDRGQSRLSFFTPETPSNLVEKMNKPRISLTELKESKEREADSKSNGLQTFSSPVSLPLVLTQLQTLFVDLCEYDSEFVRSMFAIISSIDDKDASSYPELSHSIFSVQCTVMSLVLLAAGRQHLHEWERKHQKAHGLGESRAQNKIEPVRQGCDRPSILVQCALVPDMIVKWFAFAAGYINIDERELLRRRSRIAVRLLLALRDNLPCFMHEQLQASIKSIVGALAMTVCDVRDSASLITHLVSVHECTKEAAAEAAGYALGAAESSVSPMERHALLLLAATTDGDIVLFEKEARALESVGSKNEENGTVSDWLKTIPREENSSAGCTNKLEVARSYAYKAACKAVALKMLYKHEKYSSIDERLALQHNVIDLLSNAVSSISPGIYQRRILDEAFYPLSLSRKNHFAVAELSRWENALGRDNKWSSHARELNMVHEIHEICEEAIETLLILTRLTLRDSHASVSTQSLSNLCSKFVSCLETWHSCPASLCKEFYLLARECASRSDDAKYFGNIKRRFSNRLPRILNEYNNAVIRVTPKRRKGQTVLIDETGVKYLCGAYIALSSIRTRSFSFNVNEEDEELEDSCSGTELLGSASLPLSLIQLLDSGSSSLIPAVCGAAIYSIKEKVGSSDGVGESAESKGFGTSLSSQPKLMTESIGKATSTDTKLGESEKEELRLSLIRGIDSVMKGQASEDPDSAEAIYSLLTTLFSVQCAREHVKTLLYPEMSQDSSSSPIPVTPFSPVHKTVSETLLHSNSARREREANEKVIIHTIETLCAHTPEPQWAKATARMMDFLSVCVEFANADDVSAIAHFIVIQSHELFAMDRTRSLESAERCRSVTRLVLRLFKRFPTFFVSIEPNVRERIKTFVCSLIIDAGIAMQQHKQITWDQEKAEVESTENALSILLHHAELFVETNDECYRYFALTASEAVSSKLDGTPLPSITIIVRLLDLCCAALDEFAKGSNGKQPESDGNEANGLYRNSQELTAKRSEYVKKASRLALTLLWIISAKSKGLYPGVEKTIERYCKELNNTMKNDPCLTKILEMLGCTDRKLI